MLVTDIVKQRTFGIVCSVGGFCGDVERVFVSDVCAAVIGNSRCGQRDLCSEISLDGVLREGYVWFYLRYVYEVSTVDGVEGAVGVGYGPYHHVGIAGFVADGNTSVEFCHRAAGGGVGGFDGIVGEVGGFAKIEVYGKLRGDVCLHLGISEERIGGCLLEALLQDRLLEIGAGESYIGYGLAALRVGHGHAALPCRRDREARPSR